MDERANKVYDSDHDCNPNCFSCSPNFSPNCLRQCPKNELLCFQNPGHGVPISKFRLFWGRLVASGASLQRLRPSWNFLEALGRFYVFFGGVRLVIDRGHIVFDAILSIVAQTLCIGLCFYMGEACSDVSKKSILSHRHTNLRVSPLHAHMANSKHKRLSINADLLFRIHTRTRKYITFSCHPLG